MTRLPGDPAARNRGRPGQRPQAGGETVLLHATGDAEAPRGGYCAGRLSVEAVEASRHSETKESMLARAGSASGPIFSARR